MTRAEETREEATSRVDDRAPVDGVSHHPRRLRRRAASVGRPGAAWLAADLSLAVALFAASGCSLLNAPADLRPFDGGVPTDAPDGDAPDGEPDGGDGGDAGPCDGGLCPPTREVECDDRLDDDLDGAFDCDDFDCVGRAECCVDRPGTVLDEPWANAMLADRWVALPDGAYARADTTAHVVHDFGDAHPRALRSAACVPLRGGVEIRTTLVRRATPCAGDDCFAAVALTGAERMAVGRRLLADLAIELHDDGRLLVTQAGVARSDVVTLASTDVEVVATLFPAALDGREVLRARVSYDDRTGGPIELVRDLFVLRADELRDDVDGCLDAAGLFVAVEGLGDAVGMRPLAVTAQDCASPSDFTVVAAGAGIDRDDLGLGDWASAAMSAPSLANTLLDDAARADVVVEGTNADPDFERLTHVGYSLGHAYRTATGTRWAPSAAGEVYVGAAVPSCLPASSGSCEDPAPSVREPALVADPARPGTFLLAVSRELVDGDVGERDIHGIYVNTTRVDAAGTLAAVQFDESHLVLAPAAVGDGAACRSLRDPALVAQPTGHWLYFTCEPAVGPTAIHAVALDTALRPRAGSHTVILTSALGGYAGLGVRAPEVLVEQSALSGTVHRVWFVAKRVGTGEASVGLVQGRSDDASTLPETFEPYPGNPVITATSPALGACDGRCRLLGAAVARERDSSGPDGGSSQIRFLVARRVNPFDAPERHELVSLWQTWRP